jgi:hypothetical protein
LENLIIKAKEEALNKEEDKIIDFHREEVLIRIEEDISKIKIK